MKTLAAKIGQIGRLISPIRPIGPISPIFCGLFLAFTAVAHAQYDEGGNPIKITTVFHGDGTRTDTTKDIDNRTEQAVTYNRNNQVIHKWVFALDYEGRQMEGVCYNAKDQIVARVSYKYNPFGHRSEMLEKSPTGVVLRRTIYHRDPATGSLRKTEVQEFDRQGNPLTPQKSEQPKGRR